MKTILFLLSLNGFLTDETFYISLISCVLFAGVLIITSNIAEGNISQEIAKLEYFHFKETGTIRTEVYKCHLKIREDTDRALRRLVISSGGHYKSSCMKWEWEDVIWIGRSSNEKSSRYDSYLKNKTSTEEGMEKSSII